MEVSKVNFFGEEDSLEMRILDKLYPIGSLYWTDTPPENGGDPNEFIGGSWKRLKGSFVKAANDNDVVDDNVIVGVKTVNLQTKHLPKHTHSISGHRHAISGSISETSGGFAIDSSSSNYDGMVLGFVKFLSSYERSGKGSIFVDNNWADAVFDLSHDHTYTGGIGGIQGNSTDNGNFSNYSFSVIPKNIKKYCWERFE